MSETLTLTQVTKIFILAENMKQYNGTNTNSVHVERLIPVMRAVLAVMLKLLVEPSLSPL